jgi:branched-chain amino acid transport system ATP-binding protein
MLDEPSLGLAPVMVERIVSGIARVTEDFDMSVLMVEQNIGAAAALADRVVVMNVGRVTSVRDATGAEGFDIDELTAMYWGQHRV